VSCALRVTRLRRRDEKLLISSPKASATKVTREMRRDTRRFSSPKANSARNSRGTLFLHSGRYNIVAFAPSARGDTDLCHFACGIFDKSCITSIAPRRLHLVLGISCHRQLITSLKKVSERNFLEKPCFSCRRWRLLKISL